jgi:hypothetical protein
MIPVASDQIVFTPLTGKSWSAAATFSFRVLAHVEDQAAFLPTPSTRISELRALEGDERTQYLVATAYHTAYVMGLLCAASLQRGHEPAAELRSDKVRPALANEIIRLLDTDGRSPHCREEFWQLTEQEADALAEFLINVAIHRRFASRDFEGVHAILELAYGSDLANTPLVRQAAEMLHRLATYGRVIHGRTNTAPAGIRNQDMEGPRSQYVRLH